MRLSFFREISDIHGIDLFEQLREFGLTSIKDFIQRTKVEDVGNLSEQHLGYKQISLSNLIEIREVDLETSKPFPTGKTFYKLKNTKDWKSKYHKKQLLSLLSLEASQAEMEKDRDYEDIVNFNKYHYDEHTHAVVNDVALQANFDSTAPKTNFVPHKLRMNVRALLMEPDVLNNSPMLLEDFAKIYKEYYRASIEKHAQAPIFDLFQILRALGEDVNMEHELKYDEELKHTVKFMRIRGGCYITEDRLLDFHGRKRMEVGNVRKSGACNFDDLWIECQEKLMGILYLSPEMIKQNGKIMKFKYNPKTVFGLVGITAERLTDFYALIYMARLPFAHMGFTSPSRAIQKVLGKVCYRSRAGEYRLIEKI